MNETKLTLLEASDQLYEIENYLHQATKDSEKGVVEDRVIEDMIQSLHSLIRAVQRQNLEEKENEMTENNLGNAELVVRMGDTLALLEILLFVIKKDASDYKNQIHTCLCTAWDLTSALSMRVDEAVAREVTIELLQKNT